MKHLHRHPSCMPACFEVLMWDVQHLQCVSEEWGVACMACKEPSISLLKVLKTDAVQEARVEDLK